MWSKMLLLSLNVLVLLAIVDSGNVVFKDQVIKKNPDNETGNVDHKIQSSPVSASDSESNKKEVNCFIFYSFEEKYIQRECILIMVFNVIFQLLTLGLYDATLNIDRSLNSLSTHDSKSDQNIVISPISIAAAMSLILLAARGKTKTEVGKLFNFDEGIISQTTEK